MDKSMIIGFALLILTILGNLGVTWYTKAKEREQRNLEFLISLYGDFLASIAIVGNSGSEDDGAIKMATAINKIYLVASKKSLELMRELTNSMTGEDKQENEDLIRSRMVLSFRKDLQMPVKDFGSDFEFRFLTSGKSRKTIPENSQMLCKQCKRSKSER